MTTTINQPKILVTKEQQEHGTEAQQHLCKEDELRKVEVGMYLNFTTILLGNVSFHCT